jgi:TRAP transporter TAXI family solute receptor
MGTVGALGLAGCTGPLGGGSGGRSALTMMTSTEDTAAYQMSQGLAAVVNENSDSIQISARPGDGAKQSMRLLDSGEADLAYTDTLNAYRISNQKGAYGDKPFDNDIQQVWHYYDIQGGLVTRESTDIRTVNDLAGAAVSPNPVGTAMRDVMLEHLSHADFNLDDMQELALGYGEEASALAEGRADAVTDIRINAELTPSYVQEQYSIVEDAWLIGWPDSTVSSIQDDDTINGSYYDASTMEGPNYGDRTEEWWTDTVYVTFVRSEMDQEVLSEILTIMWDNVESLTEYHSLASAWQKKSFLSGKLSPAIPIHPAAKNFFDDIGADYPSS